MVKHTKLQTSALLKPAIEGQPLHMLASSVLSARAYDEDHKTGSLTSAVYVDMSSCRLVSFASTSRACLSCMHCSGSPCLTAPVTHSSIQIGHEMDQRQQRGGVTLVTVVHTTAYCSGESRLISPLAPCCNPCH